MYISYVMITIPVSLSEVIRNSTYLYNYWYIQNYLLTKVELIAELSGYIHIRQLFKFLNVSGQLPEYPVGQEVLAFW